MILDWITENASTVLLTFNKFRITSVCIAWEVMSLLENDYNNLCKLVPSPYVQFIHTLLSKFDSSKIFVSKLTYTEN